MDTTGDTAAALAALAGRLARVERSARRWRAAAIGVAVLAVAGVVVGAVDRPAASDVVRTRRLEVVDAAGNVRVLAEATTNPAVTVYKPDGEQGVMLQTAKFQSMVAVGKPGGSDFASLMELGGGRLALFHGGRVLTVATTDCDAPQLEVHDDRSETVWQVDGHALPPPARP